MNASPRATDMVEVGRLLYEKGLIASTEGNLSVRLGGDRFLLTPAGLCKGRMGTRDLVVVDGSGRRVSGDREPTTETDLHLRIYHARPDVNAVVHAHPPTATGFAVAGVPLADCVLPEILVTVGSVPLAPYGTPGEADLAEKALPTAKSHDAFLLKNHGAVALGGEIWQAFRRMEMIESFAKTLLTAKMLGRVEPLAPEEVAKLLGLRPTPPKKEGGCGGCGTCTHGGRGGCSTTAATAPPKSDEDALVAEILRRVERRLTDSP
ncbi:MAG: class II aldolase/adducin family protein [Candidatus Eisenbacteria bacterium]